jgi:DNA-binding response OmpR family regulator
MPPSQPPITTRHALIVEDDQEIAQLVKLHLKDIHCDADIAVQGSTALALYAQNDYDIVILDLNLPDIDGLSICRHLRSRDDYIPILMLTAKTTELDRVVGLEMGADDYLTKPFSFPELVARIKALLRRMEVLSANTASSRSGDTSEILVRGELRIEISKHQVLLKDRTIELTAREFDLLLQFARHPGRVFSRAQLLDQVWGYGHEGYEHTVNSHINRLRAKLEENPAEPHFILTVWGVGYKFTETP